MEDIYTNFAYIYDKLTYDIDYSKWADYIEKIFNKYNVKPNLVLDLGCGTGNFCIEMASRGYDMIGVDISTDMLACAREKTAEKQLNVLYLNQNMTGFELYGTVDAIVCLLDSMNYITSKRDVSKLFKLIKNYLNPGGLFIFDINSEYKLEHILGNNVFYDINDEITYIWQNSYDKKKKVCTFDLTFFAGENGIFRKYEETHIEKAYSVEEMKELIAGTGLSLLEVFDGLGFNSPSNKSERIFLVCRR